MLGIGTGNEIRPPAIIVGRRTFLTVPQNSTQAPVVLLLITNFDIGGAERIYVHTAKALAQRGSRVVAACLQWRSGRVAEELAGTTVRVHDLGMRGKFDLRVLFRLARLLRQERVDIVYTFLIHAHIIGRTTGRISNVPVILSSQQTEGWETWNQRWMNRITARWCSAIVAVSKSVEQYLLTDVGISLEKIVTIYNSVDVERFPPRAELFRNPSNPTLGTVARLNPEKDYDTLLEAFQRVLQSYPGTRLLIAGDGPERPRLERKVHSLELGNSVQFLGHVEDVTRVFAQLDVYVQSSHIEGFSVAILEALASGLPVVATRVGGNSEAVLDNVCGLLVEPRNPKALAAALCELLKDPERSRRMGAAARQHARQSFSNDAAMARMEALIRQLLYSRRPRAA